LHERREHSAAEVMTEGRETGQLSPKQLRFVDEYMLDTNATQAAIRAWYSEKSAHVQGTHLLANPKICAEIQCRRKRQADKFEIQADDVIRGLHAEATYKGKNASHGARVNAWTQLGRYLGLFVDKIQLTHHADEELAELRGVKVAELPE